MTPKPDVAKRPWTVLIIVAAIPIGFMVGAWLGARLLVPDDAGLAGGAMVFWFGVLGSVLGLVGGGVFARRADGARLRKVALITAVLAAGMLALMTWILVEQQRGRDTQRQQAKTRLPPFSLTLDPW